MKKQHLLWPRLPAGLVTVALISLGSASVKADVVYAFAEQTISALSLTPSAGGFTNVSTVNTNTSDAATVNGSGTSHSDPTDAPQTYLGTPPPAPENDFAKWATFGVGSPLPTGTLPTGPGNFTRGDVFLSLAAPNTSSVVAESNLNAASGSETGAGALTASVTLTPTAAATLTIKYDFANDAYVATTGIGAATANYKFNITIKDAAGNVVFNSNTTSTSISLSAPPNGGEIIRSGTESVTTPTLNAGTAYTLIFSDNANTSAAVGVPEPGSLALAAMGGSLAVVTLALRRRSSATVAV